MIASGGPRPPRGTLTQLFFESLERYRLPGMYRVKRNGAWVSIPHTEVLDRVRRISLGLRSLGLVAGDRVAILSENCPEWAFTDWACLAARLADVPVYPTLPAEQITHLLANSGAKAIFVSTDAQAAKI
ncbi:MAG TPA: AMP-binding protein, partial [Gemmatimonadaceae bacterium]|nr:AMP-binding protein [Gemmatimonadaceae bacterium]